MRSVAVDLAFMGVSGARASGCVVSRHMGMASDMAICHVLEGCTLRVERVEEEWWRGAWDQMQHEEAR